MSRLLAALCCAATCSLGAVAAEPQELGKPAEAEEVAQTEPARPPPPAPVLRGPKSGPPTLDLGTVNVPLLWLGAALLVLALFFKRATPAHR